MRIWQLVRAAVWVVASFAFGCAAGDSVGRDASDEGGIDAAIPDTGMGMEDAGMPEDAGTDAGPPIEIVGTCELCAEHAECGAGSFCALLTGGERACVPGCNIDLPDCPRSFNCVLDFTIGVDSAVCLPIGALCCIDEDADEHGQGIGCLGPDCDDDDPLRNPAMAELCNGIDDDCDGSPDDPPTDCASGRCTDDGDGTYTAVTGADCVDAMCESGTTTDCNRFTCSDGGEDGISCAFACAPMGIDDELFCIDAAHCDANLCQPDVPNGSTCDEDTDCISGHCDNGFCCDSGVCCGDTVDCPGGGSPTVLCDDARTCQGTRGETMCSPTFRCETIMGLADDSACDSSTMALDCAPYDPVFCDGTTDQPSPVCPRSCVGDGECVDAAHCELGVCIPDRPPGGLCSRQPDCQAGLFCVDGVCCGSTCTGTCEACDLPGSAGTCIAVPATADPDAECAGFSCAAFYDGFSGGADVCYVRQNVNDSQASCNGAGACINPMTLCPFQPRGAVQVDCDNTCQTPVAGTCTGMIPGSCLDLDNPADTTSCGLGECARTVQRCVGGRPNSCTPGTPSVEICNTLDDDCDGVPDDGSGADLCPFAPFAMTYMCTAGVCSFMCTTGRHDLNSVYADGCECVDDMYGNACAGLTSLGAIGVGATTAISGTIVPTGEEDWFSVGFPASSRGPGEGNPQITLTGATAGNFELDFFTDCSTTIGCGSGTASGVGSYSFEDTWSAGYTVNATPWPTTVVFRVRRVVSTTLCSDASYTVIVSR